MGPGYRSVIGEWGGEAPAGPYEASHPAMPVPELDQPDVPDDRAAATSLVLGKPVSGQVHIGQDVDWYSVLIPGAQHSLTLTLGGEPTVRAAVALYDATGAAVPVTEDSASTQDSTILHAAVTPGVTYALRIEQPPFSAMVSFDTSGSLGAYVSYLPQALRVYAAGVVPGQEAIGIQPFGEPPLLPDWSDDAFVLGNVAATYVPGWNVLTTSDSSALEDGMLNSLAMLEHRQGARAVLVATDAETTSYGNNEQMWRALETVGPQVFTVLIGGTGQPVFDHHTMQDLALVGDGWYAYARSHADVDHAFDRLATWLRRPAAYTLEADAAPGVIKPPAPGALDVVTAHNADGSPGRPVVAPDVAVELVLDTSGSMRGRFGKSTRIAVAQQVLTSVIHDDLPQGMPVALRMFTQRPRSCDTELLVPLSPLDQTTMAATIQGVHIVNSVRTPLAAAIEKVGDDLASVTGPRIVIIVSDGRETCGGDPVQAVRDLTAKGLDVALDIVGLGLDRAGRKALRAIAHAGNGTYHDARDPKTLEEAISAAFSAPFEVLDEGGTIVARGKVDGPTLKLPPGTYRVVVLSDPPTTLEAVAVTEGSTTAVTVRAPPPTH